MKTKSSNQSFWLMFLIVFLLNIGYSVLRSVRNTLAVVDLGSGAQSIPIFEILGALPGSLIMTCLLTWLLARYSIHKVFLITMGFFVGFFLLFSYGLYPILSLLKQREEVGSTVLQCCSMLFYVMSELWKPALAIILFWGLVNQYTPAEDAKKLYAPLMLGGSLGAMVGGPFVSFSTSETIWKFFPLADERWAHALAMMMTLIAIIGVIAAFLYYYLWKIFDKNEKLEEKAKSKANQNKLSMMQNLRLCVGRPQLRLLAWIVIADYIAYSLGEVIFMDVLKRRFPEACDYCDYMGQLSFWSGLLTVISSLFIAPLLLMHYRWAAAALVTPICLLITEGFFFFIIRGRDMGERIFGWTELEWLTIVVILGSIQYCICRAAKHTLFDSSKELAFVLMPQQERMQGKLIIDGFCARLGRGAASLFSLTLIKLSGGVFASAMLSGVFALAATVSWIASTCKLGRMMEPEQDPASKEGASSCASERMG